MRHSRLWHTVNCPGAASLLGQPLQGGQEDDARFGPGRAEASRRLKTVKTGHSHIHQDHVRAQGKSLLYPGDAIAGLSNHSNAAAPGERSTECPAHCCIIIHHHDSQSGRCHGASSTSFWLLWGRAGSGVQCSPCAGSVLSVAFRLAPRYCRRYGLCHPLVPVQMGGQWQRARQRRHIV
jgi:hypothetical protein